MKIAVGMSGGVDSSVAAYILQKQGHEIISVTMRQYDNKSFGFDDDEGINQAIVDAKKVCEHLGIKHFVIDIQKEFKDIVIKNFIDEYKNGRTPNPCTLCNRTIKWGAFGEKVFSEFGVDKIATGHYIKLVSDAKGEPHLFRAIDKSKDQSYMLWELTKRQLSKTLFPLSDYSKSKIRKIASEIGLDVAQKSDSQEVCFIKGHYKDFLKNQIRAKEGIIRFIDGKIIGKHHGISFYTIGQRKGLNTPWSSALYVYKIDPVKNEIVVTDNPDDLRIKEFYIYDANWLHYPDDIFDLSVMVRYNSSGEKVEYIEKVSQNRYKIILKSPKKAVTAGQSAVFYKKDEMIGGGIIAI